MNPVSLSQLKLRLLTMMLFFIGASQSTLNAQCATLINAGGMLEICDGESVNVVAELDVPAFNYDFEWLADGVAIPGEGGVGDNAVIGYTPAGSVKITVSATYVGRFPPCDVMRDTVSIIVRSGATFVKCTMIDDFSEPGTASTIAVNSAAMGGPAFATVTSVGVGGGGIIGNSRTNNLWYVSGAFGSRADVLEDNNVFLASPPFAPMTPNPFFGEWFYSSSNDDGNESDSELIWENGVGGLNWTDLCGCETDPTAAFRLLDYFADQSGVMMTLTLTDDAGLEAMIIRDMPGSNFGEYDEQFALVDFTVAPGFNWCEIDKIALFMNTNNISVDFKFREFTFCKTFVVELSDDDRKLCLGECLTLDTMFNCPIPAGNIPGDVVSWTDENGNPLEFDAEVCIDAGGTYDYNVTVVDELGCESILSQRFTVCDTPAISISAGPICVGKSVTINNTVTGGNGPLSYSWSPATGLSCTDCEDPIASPTSTTTYYVTITTTETGDNGDKVVSECAGTGNVTVVVFPLPVVEILGDTILCDGTPTTEICASTDGVDYLWSPGGETTKCINVAAGSYSVLVTDGNTCTAEASVIITDVPTPTVVATSDEVMVCDGSSATLTATGSGGTPLLTYEWSTGQTGSPISVTPSLPSTTYTVTVTDRNECSSTDTVTVAVSPNTVDATVTVVADTCNKGLGSATAIPSGGTGPYDYEWSTGAITKTITGLTSGTYTVTVTDFAECEAVDSGMVLDVGGPSVNITGAHPICNGDSITLTANPSGGASPYDYVWSPGGSTDPAIKVAPTSTTTYSVVVTDDNDCTATAEVEVIVNNGPTIILTPLNPEICLGTSVSLSAVVIGGTPTYVYAWTGVGLSCYDCANPSANPTATTTYTLLVTDANNCTDEKDVTVTVNPRPEVTITSKVDEDCNMSNGSATALGTGGTGTITYSWNTNPAQTTPTITGLSAGTYQVIITDEKGCKDTAQTTIINNGAPEVTITGSADPDSSCIGDDVTLTANPLPFPGPYTYAWSDGLGATQSVTVTNVLATKIYSVLVTDTITQCTARAEYTLKVKKCSEITHTKTFVSVVTTGLNTYDVTYEIIVENIGKGAGVYDLLDSLAFDPDVIVGSVVYSTDAVGNPGNPGPIVPTLNGMNRYVLADDQTINDVDPHTYTLVVGVSLDLDNPPVGGNGIYNPCLEVDPGNYVPKNGLYNLSILDTPNDLNDERDEACGDIPYIRHTKEFNSLTQINDNCWWVKYDIEVSNSGGATGDYNLYDSPRFENDVEIISAEYDYERPCIVGAAAAGPLAGTGPWTLGEDVSIIAGASHCYTVSVEVCLDLEDGVGNAGDDTYDACATGIPGTPSENEGLFNESQLDLTDDGHPEQLDTACVDLPYIIHNKTLTNKVQVGPNLWEVTYQIEVENIGGAAGEYDLRDEPVFDEDIEILSVLYTSDAPGNPGMGLPNSGPWTLASGQDIDEFTTHLYDVVVDVEIDLEDGINGDDVYQPCGLSNPDGYSEKEGLFNRSLLNIDEDDEYEQRDSVCEDLPYIIHDKTVSTPTQTGLKTFTVVYEILVQNIGGEQGSYSLNDEPVFDDDITIDAASFVSDIPTAVTPLGATPWTLITNQLLDENDSHTFTITVDFTLDLEDGVGDETYTACGNGVGDPPRANQGLFNRSLLDVNVDGITDKKDSVCIDVPAIEHVKTFSRLERLSARCWKVVYDINVENVGGASGQYDLYDSPRFDDDITITGGAYNWTVPCTGAGAVGAGVLVGSGPWQIADDIGIAEGDVHCYEVEIDVCINLEDNAAGVPGDDVYTPCEDAIPGTPSQFEGLFNESQLDLNNDGNPDQLDTACVDLPYVIHEKNHVSSTRNGLGDYTVVYEIVVSNIGGAEGQYDLIDVPNFDDDFEVTGVQYSSDAPGNVANPGPLALPIAGPYSLANNQDIDPGVGNVQTYTLTFDVLIDLQTEASAGDEIYNACGSNNPGTPQGGEGLFNRTMLDVNDDGMPDERDTACVDIEIVDLALRKRLVSTPPYTYGEDVIFEITVFNQGNVTMKEVEVTDYIADGYVFNIGDNPGWSNTAPTVSKTIAEVLAPRDSIKTTITLELAMTNGGERPWINYSEISKAIDLSDQDRTLDDEDSTPSTNNPTERGVEPGDPADDDILSRDKGGEEDDHDPAGPEIFDLAQIVVIDNEQPFYDYGDDITFKLTITNQGNEPASDIRIVDYVPDGFIYNPADNPTWTQSATNTPMTLAGLDLDPGETKEIFIVLELRPTDEVNGHVNYTEIEGANGGDGLPRIDIDSEPNMQVDNDEGGQPDTPNDNRLDGDGTVGNDEDDHDPARPRVFDLAQIKQVVTGAPYEYGQGVIFEFTVVNQGNVPATNITITDSIPEGFSFVAGGVNTGWSNTYPEIEFTIADTLFEKDTHRIQVELILEMTDGGADKYTNLSEISAAQDTLGMPGGDADSDPDSEFDNDAGGEPDSPNDDRLDGDGTDDEDDEDPARIEIHDLALRKTTSEVGPFNYTDIITIDLWVFNQGNETATNVELTEYIPIGFGYQASNNGNWSYDSGSRKATLTSLIPTILPGDSQRVQIDLELLQAYDAEAWDNFAEISDDKDENGDPVDDIDSTPDDENNDDGGEPNGPTDDEIDEESPIDEDDHDPFRPDVVDLALNKKVPGKLPYYAPGDTVPYKITVYNQGNVDVQNTLVRDYIPAGFIFDNTIPENAGWSSVGPNLEFTYGPVIESQDSAKIDLFLIVQIPAAPTLLDWTNYAEIAGTEDTEGVDRTNDDADSNPGSDEAHERAVMDNDDGDPDDDNILGDYKNKGEDEDDHDPEKVEVTGALGDKVWKDLDGDGIQDDGEPGVEGVIITLYTCDGTFVKKDTTDADGNYLFDFLIPLESYFAIFDIAPLNNPDCVFTFPNEGVNDSLDSDVNAAGIGPCTFIEPGERDSTYDAGLVQLASLGDFVWHDRNANGIQEVDEPGIEGVKVTLYNADGTVARVTYTDEDGLYLFEDLMPMEYYVGFEYMDMWSRSPSNEGGDDELDSDVDDTNGPNTTETTDLDPGENDLSWDLGLYKCVEVGDVVWFDLDADGVQDPNENGINGVRVYIFDDNGDLVDEAVTGAHPSKPSADGYFKFCVDPGSYYIVFERPGHLAASYPYQAGPEFDSDITHQVELNSTYIFAVLSGDMRCDIDGGFHSKATMGDRVWIDQNRNGIQDGGEPRLPGVVISAYDDQGMMFWQDESDANGEFVMDGLSKGDYFLKFDPPAGYSFTAPDMGNNDGKDSDVDGSNGPRTTALYRVNAGEHEPDVDAGFVSGFLPIELLEFNAELISDYVELTWTTGSEINSSHFNIERRHESETSFRQIGREDARGNSFSTFDYDHNDYDLARTGVYYYRLELVDNDRSTSYSEVEIIQILGEGSDLTIYPNPATGILNVRFTTVEKGEVRIEMYDELGRLANNSVIELDVDKGTRTEEVDIENLSEGIYTLKVFMDGQVKTVRFTKM